MRTDTQYGGEPLPLPATDRRQTASLYAYLDAVRRLQGTFLDAFGLGPEEAPSRIVFSERVMTLKAYGKKRRDGPVMLIVPAPIKRAYIWDMAPEASVVRECLRGGIGVYMIHWKEPGLDDQGTGLDGYAGRFMTLSMDAIARETGEDRVFLAGHSLGGTLCAVFASGHKDRVKGLILVETPLKFGPALGDIDAMVAKAPEAQRLTKDLGNVPGFFISSMSTMASPGTFRTERFQDLLSSLGDLQDWQMHMRVVRWTLDELPMPKKLFEEVMEYLYREDRFMRGKLTIEGRPAVPSGVESPIVSIADQRSRVVSPESCLAFHDAASSTDKQVFWYRGDVGVAIQHAGVLVGKNAHRYLWPEIVDWVNARSRTE